MIIEHLTSELIPGHAVLWPSIILFIAGFLFAIFAENYFLKTLAGIIGLVGVAGISECIYSATKMPSTEDCPITKVEAFPVEYREENNKIYVFVNGAYKTVSTYTSEYVEADDTMFRYHYESIGGQLKWGEGYYKTFKRKTDVTYVDSLDFSIELAPADTTMLQIGEDGTFIAKPDTLE